MPEQGSPWQRRVDATRLASTDGAQLQGLQRLLQETEDGWRCAWGLGAAVDPVRCEPLAAAAHAGAWEVLGQRAGATVLVLWSGASHGPLYAEHARCAPLAAAANAACRDDRIARLAAALLLERPAWRAAAAMPSGRWSGSVRAVLPCGSELHLDAGAVTLLAPGRPAQQPALPALVPALQAAAGRRLRLQARLADCTLHLGQLQDLQPGDVVRLDHRLDAPLHLHAPDAPVFAGFLAAHRGHKAVELAPTSAASNTEKAQP